MRTSRPSESGTAVGQAWQYLERVAKVHRACLLGLLTMMLASFVVHGQVFPLFTYNHVQFPASPVPMTEPDGTEAGYGTTLVGLGGGRFAVGVPKMDVNIGRFRPVYVTDGGFVGIRDQAGVSVAGTSVPRSSLSYYYGTALAAFPDGRLLVGAGDAVASASGTFYEVGNVYLHQPNGALLRSWPNPAGPTSQTFFGRAVAALPGDRLAASSREGFGKVFIFDASQVAGPQVIITNPTPAELEIFGFALAPLGTDRLLIGDHGDMEVLGKPGSVFIYDYSGNRLRTIRNPVEGDLGSANFGETLVAVDEHRFLVGAPIADARYLANGTFLTNQNAGAVYLFDDTGALLRTFVGLEPARSGNFGASIAMLGPNRILIGAPFDRLGTLAAGRAHLFNLDGIHLGSVDNPDAHLWDRFGASVAAIDERRFVVGAPDDDTQRPNAGSIYGFDAPMPAVELGALIPQPEGVDKMGTFVTQGPTVSPAGAAFWHVPSQKLFAVKPGGILVSWRLQGDLGTNNWEASATWPTNDTRYQTHVASQTAVDVADGGAYSNVVLHATTTAASLVATEANRWFTSATPGDSLLMLSPGNPTNSPIHFQFVRSIAWNDPTRLHDQAPATVGQPIVDPAGYHDPGCGSPQVVLLGGVYCPEPVFDPATRTGTIIPVNRDNPANPTDDLVVAFFRHGTNLHDADTGLAVNNSICWPHQAVRFLPEWPTNAPKIVIASQQGTGAIDPTQFVDWEHYFQNSPSDAGFNPNDEHAVRRPLGAGEALLPLRNDLGTAATSEPFVLIRFRDPANAGQWRLKVWQVIAEEAPFFFRYTARAGLLIQAPFPISTLAIAPPTTGVSGPFWRDRKLFHWARAAGDDGGSAEIVMRYFYPVQPGFFFPGANPPPVGANVPLLDLRAGTAGIPIDVRYDTTWPTEVPELRVGETLVKPKNGLPQIAGQSSVEVLYQQSVAQGQEDAVRLIDPVRTRSAGLTQLPADLGTRVNAGLLHFPTLPPHLERRVSYDPVTRQLQLRGEFVEPPAGESYLLLNVLTPRDRAILAGLSTDAAWQTAVGTLAAQAAGLLEVPSDSTGFDSLALTAGDARGTGYVTLAFGNSATLSAPAEPISLRILKVTCPLYRGELKVIESPNPLAELLTLRHSGDFAGRPDRFEFEWRTLPPVDGLPSPLPPPQWTTFQPTPATGLGALDITISGPGLYTLSDNYFVCRYRRVSGVSPCGADWSSWTPPMLAEGWIKRVLAGIGPFEQRIQDYQGTQVNTIVSMISQAGARAVGDVALNLEAVNQAGLIEVYETVLRRGMGLSIEGAPPVNYPPANDALLLAAGRLADLYQLLGNEAYADAADPTIAFGTDDGVYGSQATSLHCFMNQTASLLEEELGLLRGRDTAKLPSVQTHPIYNRLLWNFTRDITGGEVAYALNYNIRNASGDVAGVINEADAQRLYPQGHGDAWGHYLAAIKHYYRLLRNAHFDWVPRIEAIVVGGAALSVDYLDERKFAGAAAARARTGAEIVNLTFRGDYLENPGKPWQGRPDTDAHRAWSPNDWSSRAGQGALFDWVVANAILPDVDSNPNHTGIQKIERANIRELPEIAEAFRQVQEQADQADQGRNPLGLANNVVPFDIDPGAIAAGRTHFEQINERANKALDNAVAVFNHANESTQLLRRQADDVNTFQQQVEDREADFNNRLIEVFGTPYTDDIGPAGTYPTGYGGADLYHYDYVDSPEIRSVVTGPQPTLRFELSELGVGVNGALTRNVRPVTFHFSPTGTGLVKPPTWTGQRRAPGEIQMARSALMESLRRLERGVKEYEDLVAQVVDAAESLQAEFGLNDTQIRIRQGQLDRFQQIDDEIRTYRFNAGQIRAGMEMAQNLANFAVDSLPKVVGLATDAFSFQGALLRLTARSLYAGAGIEAQYNEEQVVNSQEYKNRLAAITDLELFTNQTNFAERERLRQLEQLVRGEPASRLELAALRENLDQALGRYQAAVARGLRLLEERTRFRQGTAAQIQTYRYKDMAFRI
ncbi:MAG: hypothetical protein ACYC23_16065, partial [Limisphaerales bacterium]